MKKKSMLNELCQTYGWPIPVYTVVREGGMDHAPSFSASVYVDDNTYKGSTNPNKKEAEEDAASIALEALNIADNVTRKKHKSNLNPGPDYVWPPNPENPRCTIHFFYDVENTHIANILERAVEMNCSYKVTAALSDSSLSRCRSRMPSPREDPRVKVVTIPSAEKDVADQALKFLAKEEYVNCDPGKVKIAMVTCDKFAWSTVTVIKHLYQRETQIIALNDPGTLDRLFEDPRSSSDKALPPGDQNIC